VGAWRDRAGVNLLDGGAPFYDTYRCADGRFVAVAALEPQFYDALLDVLDLDAAGLPPQMDPRGWPALRTALTEAFASRPRDAWAQAFAGVEACVAPVLDWAEAAADPHLASRATLVEVDGVVQAAPAPRLSRSGARPPAAVRLRDDTAAVLADWTRPDPAPAPAPTLEETP
jgi:alpha-methylacyl-CoA racemase